VQLKSPSNGRHNGPLLLPPVSGALVTLGSLPAFIREQNNKASSRVTLHIWTAPRKKRRLGDGAPLVLRFGVRDLLCAYVRIAPGGDEAPLRVMSVTCVGYGEVKAPHLYSDYTVLQQMSQHFARVLCERPDVSLGLLIELLWTYDSLRLFEEPCSSCGNILSAAGHLAPVGRIWGEEEGRWETRHLECFFSG